jgi:uncharacterized protein
MYNCKKCPGYCCTYPLIALDKRDVQRLAKHFDMTFEKAKAKFTVERWGYKYSMRRKADKLFGRACRFFDTEKRCCSVYEARPSLCRTFPGGRCGYYDFLSFERRAQKDPEFIATTNNKLADGAMRSDPPDEHTGNGRPSSSPWGPRCRPWLQILRGHLSSPFAL